MKITRIECWLLKLKLSQPYEIAYESFDSAANVFIAIETSEGITGYGCAAPDQAVTGETAEQVVNEINNVIKPLLLGEDPLKLVFLLEKIRPHLTASPAPRAAADIALYDSLAKKAGLPLWQLFGGYRHRILTSVTIGILPVDDTIAHAKDYISKGFKCLKVKGGKNVEEDIYKLIRLREVIGKKTGLRFDANQGYNLEQTFRFVEETDIADLELIEQPTSKTDPDLLGKITRKSPTPIMADESMLSLLDAFKLTKNTLIDMVNVKLMKTGGLFEAFQINAVARAAGVEVMVGCMDECALSISAGLHYALARPNVIYADLDGHLDLIDDPTAGCVRLKNGYLYPSSRPGLGLPGKL